VDIRGDIQRLDARLDLTMVVSDEIRDQLADLQKQNQETSEVIRFELSSLRVRASEAENKISHFCQRVMVTNL
jgi:hypothetical protein